MNTGSAQRDRSTPERSFAIELEGLVFSPDCGRLRNGGRMCGILHLLLDGKPAFGTEEHPLATSVVHSDSRYFIPSRETTSIASSSSEMIRVPYAVPKSRSPLVQAVFMNFSVRNTSQYGIAAAA